MSTLSTPPDSSVYYQGKYWNDIPQVVEYLNRRATGAVHPGWMSHLKSATGKTFERALILNCGNGWVERDLIREGVVRSAVGIDVSHELLADARKAGAEFGGALTYVKTDTNEANFPPGPYDLVVNHAAAHHIARLDRVFRKLTELLPDDGVFVSWDYVGPHRNQYESRAWDAIFRLNQKLPTHLRCSMQYPHLPTMLSTDPTEAIHSELIVETMKRYFNIEHYAPLGGPIAYPMLTHNVPLLSAALKEGAPYIEEILAEDEAWVRADPMSTLFAYVVARPNKSVLEGRVALQRWSQEEDARELLGERNGGRYYAPTMVAELSERLARLEALHAPSS